MRDIKFKAKRVDNSRWIHGVSLIKFAPDDKEAQYFIPYKGRKCDALTDAKGQINRLDGVMVQRVHPKTICQFIGAKDANYREIYEGDIVRHGGSLYEIRYLPDYARFAGVKPGARAAVFSFRACTIVGNVFDNPHMMQEFYKDEEED